jgi:hypothetical protein
MFQPKRDILILKEYTGRLAFLPGKLYFGACNLKPYTMPTTSGKTAVMIDEEILTYLQTEEERTTIVHCQLHSPYPTLARIWNSTFLLEEDGRRVPLVKAFNIAMAPDWTWFVSGDGFVHFTLLFEGLSKGCKIFHLMEIIDEPGGFYSGKIWRNETDVYKVELSY